MSESYNRHKPDSERKTTTELMLDSNISLEELDQYLKETRPAPKLSSHLVQLLAERDMSNEELGMGANIGRSTIYKIISGKQLPEQDMLLRMAFVLELDASETQQLLKTGRRAQLTSSRPRDVALILGLNNGLTLDEMDEILMERGFDPLTPSEKRVSELLKPLMDEISFEQLLRISRLDSNEMFLAAIKKTKAGMQVEAFDEISEDLERAEWLRIGFALNMNRIEMQRLLRIVHRSFLNSKDPRDSLLLNGLASGICPEEMNAALLEKGLEPLFSE